MDKASIASPLQVKKGERVSRREQGYPIPVYLPTASPEFRILKQIWNIAKQDLFVQKH
jgi:hypothetical protein